MRAKPVLAGLLSGLLRGLKAVAGMPDYDAYLVHLRRCHPGMRAPSEREYYAEYLRARYDDGPTRCC
jgi:uncharacterized short protein YbdD (DUF466 family)